MDRHAYYIRALNLEARAARAESEMLYVDTHVAYALLDYIERALRLASLCRRLSGKVATS